MRLNQTITLAVCLAAAGTVYGQPTNPGVRVGFNPQPDPPGFGLITLRLGQTIGLNVVCFDHQVGSLPPDPCHGVLMFHDAAGAELLRGTYDLRPGETRTLRYTAPVADAVNLRVGIDPCWLPGPGGLAVGSVEVFDNTGKVTHFANPAADRMSYFNNGRPDPASLVGFNPQPDPPGFGMVTLKSQAIRMNVACFEHPVSGTPPDPCRGTMMFHNAAGDVVKSARYALRPGEATSLLYTPPLSDAAGAGGIIPCVLPDNGGRAVPNVEVIDLERGDTALLINPAAAGMSQFQRP